MNAAGHHPRVFYGWWVALTGALGLFLNSATVVVFTFGIFAKAIGQELHTGRSTISLAFTIHNLAAAICVPIAGWLVDRYGVRRVLIPYTIVLGLILLCGSALSNGIWELYVFYLGLGVVSGGAGVMPYTTVVSRWFDRRRGLALSVMMIGLGLGAIVIPPVAQRLVTIFGWRHAYGIFGLAILLVPLPAVAAFLNEKPESMGVLPDGAAEVSTVAPVAVDAEGLAMREAVRTSEFWIMACALGLVTACVHACFIHLPAILTDRGSTAQKAAMVSSLFGVGLLLGRVGCGYFLDQFPAPRVAAVFFACAGIGAATLASLHAALFSCAASVLVGLGVGAEVDIVAYLTTRYFGLRSFGEIFGWFWAVFGISGGIGAYLMDVGFDKTGSYTLPLAGFSVAAFTAMVFMLILGPYRYRVRTSDSFDAAKATVAPAPTLGAQ